MNNTKSNLIFIFLVIILAVISRLIPHAPNFTPIMAICIWVVAYMSTKFFFLPIIIMFFGDYFLGFYNIELMIAVYLSIVLISLLGIFLKKSKSFFNVILVSLMSSFTFYFITNFAVWYFSSWYSKNIYGLINCYIMGLPFLKNNFISDLFYLAILVYSTEFVLNGSLSKSINYIKNFSNKYKII